MIQIPGYLDPFGRIWFSRSLLRVPRSLFPPQTPCIENYAQNVFIQDLTPGDSWVGYSENSLGSWDWDASYSCSPNFVNWGIGEPSDVFGFDDCAVLQKSNGYWDDESCTDGNYCVCQMGSNGQLSNSKAHIGMAFVIMGMMISYML